MNYIQKKNYDLIVNVYKIVCVCVCASEENEAGCPPLPRGLQPVSLASSLNLSPDRGGKINHWSSPDGYGLPVAGYHH